MSRGKDFVYYQLLGETAEDLQPRGVWLDPGPRERSRSRDRQPPAHRPPAGRARRGPRPELPEPEPEPEPGTLTPRHLGWPITATNPAGSLTEARSEPVVAETTSFS